MPSNRRSVQLWEPVRWGLGCLISPFLLVWVLLFRREWAWLAVGLGFLLGPLLTTWVALTRWELEIAAGALLWEIQPRVGRLGHLNRHITEIPGPPRQRQLGPLEVAVMSRGQWVNGRLNSRGRITLRMFARCPDSRALHDQRRKGQRPPRSDMETNVGSIVIKIWHCPGSN